MVTLKKSLKIQNRGSEVVSLLIKAPIKMASRKMKQRQWSTKYCTETTD